MKIVIWIGYILLNYCFFVAVNQLAFGLNFVNGMIIPDSMQSSKTSTEILFGSLNFAEALLLFLGVGIINYLALRMAKISSQPKRVVIITLVVQIIAYGIMLLSPI